jgi:hypothetical protein
MDRRIEAMVRVLINERHLSISIEDIEAALFAADGVDPLRTTSRTAIFNQPIKKISRVRTSNYFKRGGW